MNMTNLQVHETYLNLLRWNDGATRVENFSSQSCNIFSVLSVSKYDPGKTNNKFVTSQ